MANLDQEMAEAINSLKSCLQSETKTPPPPPIRKTKKKRPKKLRPRSQIKPFPFKSLDEALAGIEIITITKSKPPAEIENLINEVKLLWDVDASYLIKKDYPRPWWGN